LRIPKLRQGSHFPPFPEPRKTSEKGLVAVIQEAWVSGVSTRRVDDLVQVMGLSGIGKSTVSELCKDIDDRVNALLDRPLVGDWPYLWLDDLSQATRGRSDRHGRGDNRHAMNEVLGAARGAAFRSRRARLP